jgi:glycosyltransferase involved in cell wall biosynthesis
MNGEQPFVSVIIPAYNCAQFLPDAVRCIQKQEHRALEIVIVDDGSTDDTAAVARSFGEKVICISQANGGPAKARNTGLEAARGEIISFLDADDLWPDGSLAILLSHLAEEPSIDVVLGQTQAMVLKEATADAPAHFELFGEPWHCPLVGCGAYRRSILDTVGFFDTTLAQSEDLDWFLRMRERGVPTMRINDVTLMYRLHEANLTHGAGPEARNMLLAIKRSLDRRRSESGGVRSLEPAADARSGQHARKGTPDG